MLLLFAISMYLLYIVLILLGKPILSDTAGKIYVALIFLGLILIALRSSGTIGLCGYTLLLIATITGVLYEAPRLHGLAIAILPLGLVIEKHQSFYVVALSPALAVSTAIAIISSYRIAKGIYIRQVYTQNQAQ